MAKMFTLKLKQSRAGMPAGTAIQVASSTTFPSEIQIAEECSRRFGKKFETGVGWSGYWDIIK